MTEAAFAVPGDLATPTGGYAYARRLMAEAAGAGLALTRVALPAGFPSPSLAELAETGRRLHTLPAGDPILIDGLALGVLPAELLRALPGPAVGLCHHPLALETGVTAAQAGRLHASERAALASCVRVIASSETTARTLAGDFGVPAAKLSVAPPGTDAAPRARGSGGQKMASGVALLAVGSLTPRKGHDVLIAALAGLMGLDWRLSIVGPADRDAAHARALAAQVEEAGLAGRVAFAGALSPGAVARAYDRADLFVLASRHEGFGMAYTEAMARGLATVGCDAGAVREATRGAARLVPPGDTVALGA
ncbi:MAG TPA: glycosyltransferase family 4 protein, partial [Thermohalobaculum sp.]|nr:glycosyltransferase family 4 protein [Thermohalobaculum sp.]